MGGSIGVWDGYKRRYMFEYDMSGHLEDSRQSHSEFTLCNKHRVLSSLWTPVITEDYDLKLRWIEFLGSTVSMLNEPL